MNLFKGIYNIIFIKNNIFRDKEIDGRMDDIGFRYFKKN